MDEQDLGGVPVIACVLHEQLAAAAAGFVQAMPQGRVICVVTDAGSADISEGQLFVRLHESGLLHGSVTTGRSAGGDLEAGTLYSGLLLARLELGADLVITVMGPGGTSHETSRTGCTSDQASTVKPASLAEASRRLGVAGPTPGRECAIAGPAVRENAVGAGRQGAVARLDVPDIHQGEAANAAASLGGRPLICVGVGGSEGDGRSTGYWENTLTVLDRVARCRCIVVVARDLRGLRRRQILDGFEELQIQERHDITTDFRGKPGLETLSAAGIPGATTREEMDVDGELFLHASAAGAAAAAMLKMQVG